jgi:pimeloyl-ACP methyl ester carboxylesterase
MSAKQYRSIRWPSPSAFAMARRWHWTACLAAAIVAASGWNSPACGQTKKSEKKSDANESKSSRAEALVLQTTDGVQLAITYYPGSRGKQAVPIVLLHGWKQSQNDYKDLAPALQKLGYAVVVPDLRGHGGSTRRKSGVKEETLDAALMTVAQFRPMVTQDMKAVKDFLWKRNNAGELNIDKLCIVGAGMGASVALDFAAFDANGYESGMVNYGPLKLARFIKALVLISPEWAFRGLPLRDAITSPVVQQDIAILILVGKQNVKSMTQAEQIYNIFKRYHPEPSGEDKLDKQTLFFGKLDTSLQGTKLLDPKFKLKEFIADFVDRRLVRSDESRNWAWKERKFPHE